MSSRKGQTLIAMYLVVVMLSILGGSFLTKGFAVNQNSRIQKLDAETFYLAQGGLEDATANFVNAIAKFQISSNPDCYPDTDNDGICTPNVSTQTDVLATNFCAQSSNCATSPFAPGTLPRAYSWVTAAAAEQNVAESDGTIVRLRNYEVVTTVTHPSNPSFSTTLHQVITRRIIYTFQHAVFYNDELEVIPGANMTLTGRVHSNADMYLDATSGVTLTIDTDYVHTPGNIYNYRKTTGLPEPGDVSIKKFNTSPSQFQLLTPGNDSTNSNWASIATTNWLGTVKTGVQGVTALAVPSVGSTAPSGSNAYYANNADIKVTNGLIQKKSGGSYVNVIECAPATVNAGNQSTCVPIGTIATNPTGTSDPNRYYNSREGKIIKMTNLDIMKLGGYYDVNSDGIPDPPGTPGNPYISNLPSNGLMYATRDDAAATEEPGIRLKNGSLVNRAGGLTVVSNDPVYIQGNFNTTAKKPVAVFADALHLLSNNWQDNKSYDILNNRVATATTFNSAFIAGIKSSVGAQYSGGLENYPRLQEKWTGITLSIVGSFVELWNSQIATGNWPGTGTVYSPPIRNWSYDAGFESGALPPFTPFAVEAIRGPWWKQ